MKATIMAVYVWRMKVVIAQQLKAGNLYVILWLNVIIMCNNITTWQCNSVLILMTILLLICSNVAICVVMVTIVICMYVMCVAY